MATDNSFFNVYAVGFSNTACTNWDERWGPRDQPIRPLKMTYRDDELRMGAKRLGYDPQNNSTIRIGWVAW